MGPQTYSSEALDASPLPLPMMRFVPNDDPRIRATVLAVADELTDDAVFAAIVQIQPTTASSPERPSPSARPGLYQLLSQTGEHDRARRLCEQLRGVASGLGFYAKRNRSHGTALGDFLQALAHLSLINAVLHIAAAEPPS
jgi:GH15 family glucan-1,4-alpha-glucosidase